MLFCPSVSAASALKEDLYAITVNGEAVSDGTVVLRRGGSFLMSEGDLKSLRLIPPREGGTRYKGQIYYALGSFPGARVEVDQGKQELEITIPAALFKKTVIDEKISSAKKTSVSGSGLFLNYDLSLTGGTHSDNLLSGLFEAGAFNRFGAGTSSFYAEDMAGGGGFIRLETAWFKDDPGKLRTFRFGDGITRAGSMGSSVRFGGVQVATNFSMDPGFIAYPAPSAIGGLANVPTTVDVLVNNVRSLSEKVPAGPFEIFNVPVVSGRGDIQLVVKDLLGREHVITLPYYFSPSLLKKGLSDYSYEAGFERENYSTESNDYGRFIASGTHRYGFTDAFTGEGHVELSEGRQFFSTAGVFLAPSLGVFSAGAALDHDGGWGGLGQAGYEYSGRRFNLGLNVKMATKSGQGVSDTQNILKTQLQTHAGFAAGKLGNMSFSYTIQKFFGSGNAKIFTANFSRKLGPGTLNLSYIDTRNSGRAYTVTAFYVLAFGGNNSVMADSSLENGSWRAGLEFQKGASSSIPDYMWRLRAETGEGGERHYQGEVTRRGEFNVTDLELSDTAGETAYRAGISGGLAYMQGGLFASRTLGQSFALAEAEGFPGVRVYLNNLEAGKTDRKGYILLPDLNPYMENTLRIEESDLPIDAKIGSLQKTVAPSYGSGAFVKFDVKPYRSAIITITAADGKPLPAGTVLTGHNGQNWFVAKNGEVYLTDLGEGKTFFSAAYGDRKCRIEINIPHDLKDIPRLGTYICGQLLRSGITTDGTSLFVADNGNYTIRRIQ